MIYDATYVYVMGATAFALFGDSRDRCIEKWTLCKERFDIAKRAVSNERNNRQPTIEQFIQEFAIGEMWDVYDKDRNKTGRLHERGKPMTLGDYHLVVHVWKRNSKGQWLIDKRTPRYNNSDLDGKWETTGGSAIAGDDSLSAALREAKEELGITLDPQKGVLFSSKLNIFENGHGVFIDVWVFDYDEPIESVAYDGSEACDAMWASADKIREMIAAGEFLDYSLYPYLDELLG